MKSFTIGEIRLERRLLLASGAFVAAAVPAAVLAYAATHGWGPLHRLDSGVASNLHAWALHAPAAVGFLEDVSTVLGPWVLRGVALGAVIALAVKRQRRLALWAGTTVAVAGVVGLGLKLIVGRARPSLPDPVSVAEGYSFPSGHALNSFAIIGVLILLALPMIPRRWRPVAWGIAGATVALIGFARVALGVHYVSDVIAGWVVAAGLLAVTLVAFETWRPQPTRSASEVVAEGVDPEGSRAAATGGGGSRSAKK